MLYEDGITFLKKRLTNSGGGGSLILATNGMALSGMERKK